MMAVDYSAYFLGHTKGVMGKTLHVMEGALRFLRPTGHRRLKAADGGAETGTAPSLKVRKVVTRRDLLDDAIASLASTTDSESATLSASGSGVTRHVRFAPSMSSNTKSSPPRRAASSGGHITHPLPSKTHADAPPAPQLCMRSRTSFGGLGDPFCLAVPLGSDHSLKGERTILNEA
ncbi:LAFE_0F04632g1_1 [Lachancea fermentati]|uniref:LAFE_0F04632g1_1 n=1 Tax=Lachancea fermentati TaxID=4955 RepID=A0A1G4MER8_LACFM|nr:LAFE_0F04632g1_1 [Lachancea fermentati]